MLIKLTFRICSFCPIKQRVYIEFTHSISDIDEQPIASLLAEAVQIDLSSKYNWYILVTLVLPYCKFEI